MNRTALFLLALFTTCLMQACGGSSGNSGDDEADMSVTAACADELDNDGDGLIDHPEDPGCNTPDDRDETDERPAQCADGEDNDEDGDVDLDDRGCSNPEDDDESDEPPIPQCANGIDDDGDEAIDLDDRGCSSGADDDESDDPPLPACSDGEDNDEDGFIDFPADPGCGSEFDGDETDEQRPLPQCADYRDNDGDGNVDLMDPGCSSPADPREQNPEESPQCSNGIDDDGDGVIDFPLEPGCSAAGDENEEDGANAPACGNGRDDDEDGQTDYPLDPGCVGIGDLDETDGPFPPGCADGNDNDRDGLIDYPDDPGCISRADTHEQAQCTARLDAIEAVNDRIYRGDSRTGTFQYEGSCGGRGSAELVFYYNLSRAVEALEITTEFEDNALESAIYVRRNCADAASEVVCNREPLNDGTAANTVRIEEPALGAYYIFLDGATANGANFAVRISEVPLAECRNGLDDDEDGRIDYPLDAGCLRLSDRTEADPDVPPACFDGEDNDGDGLIDYPLDIGCRAASDNDEVDSCGQGIPFDDFPDGEAFVEGSTDGGSNNFNGSCGGQNRVERVFRYVNEFNANITFSVNNEQTINNTLLYVRTACNQVNTELGCDTGGREATKGTVSLEQVPPGEYFVFVDTSIGIGGNFRLTVDAERLPPGCSDSRDNDEDGFVDFDDVGCSDPMDEDEVDDIDEVPICSDGLDNDEDGLTDYPYDPGCVYRGGDSEADPAELPACGDAIDNDEDGIADFPFEPQCSSAADDDEDDQRRPQCRNSIDDDDDGHTDFPTDPGCAGPGDLSETDDPRPPQCADEEDNDRNGLVDFPFDPGCYAAGDPLEEPTAEEPVCSNGLDDDEDGVTDFPRDPGCESAGSGDETDPRFPPECADGRDNDNNGRVDWPDDPGCRFAADRKELLQGAPPRRCSDGVDNDDDGQIDLSDVGCQDARDNDESDVFADNHCSDGIDNDEDGNTDWPADDGCAAQGDQCEQRGYGLCDGVCQDLVNDANHCGQCGRVCADGVECIEGFCGGLYTFEGIRQNVPNAELGGWEVCHEDVYGDRNTRVQTILDSCNGEFVMLGCRQAGQPNWQLLAMGERDSVFMNTGDRNNNLNNHNGVDWYFSAGYSIGFVSPGTGVRRNSCDVGNDQSQLRLCWHSSGGTLTGGYRCGARTGLNGARDWERKVWTSRVGR